MRGVTSGAFPKFLGSSGSLKLGCSFGCVNGTMHPIAAMQSRVIPLHGSPLGSFCIAFMQSDSAATEMV